jgi:hypothetical protein
MSSDSSRDRLAAALGDDARNVVMERGYSLGFVGVHGQVRLVQFRLSKKGFALDAAADDAEFATMLDEFTAVITRLLIERWGGIALRAAFDAEGELIERLYETGTLERWDEVDPMSPAKKLVKEGEQVDARELLVRASARLVENWGLFDKLPALTDEQKGREARLRTCIGGAAGQLA